MYRATQTYNNLHSSVKRIGRSKLFSRRVTDVIRRTRQSTVPGYHHRYLAPPPVFSANSTDLSFTPRPDGSHHRVTIPIRAFLSKPLVLATIAPRPADRLADPLPPAVRLADPLPPANRQADRMADPLLSADRPADPAGPQPDQTRPVLLPVLLQADQNRPDPAPDPNLQADHN